jgi:hypothetical protein
MLMLFKLTIVYFRVDWCYLNIAMNRADYLAFPAIVGTTGQYNNLRKMWDGQHYKYHMDRMQKSKANLINMLGHIFITNVF